MNPYDNADALLRELAAPRRNQFFYGKRMDVQHFRMEQDYGRLKQSLVNRLTLGKGVLCGLRVTIDGDRVCIDPGVAIDGLGREIVVPVRSCIDPTRLDPSCGGGSGLPSDGAVIATLWACYRECSADYQPVLVADCDTREQCAPGTTVESFCFKLTPGLAPLQRDPQWCIESGREDESPSTPDTPPAAEFVTEAEARRIPGAEALRELQLSRRRLLCRATSGPCEAGDGDPCVPLALLLLADGKPLLAENCLVRPRVYSNALLRDLILCLAQQIDDCCRDQPPVTLLQVASIDFVQRGARGSEQRIAGVETPLTPTAVPIDGRANALRIRFSRPFAQGAHRPTTPAPGDKSFKRHNVLVLPDQVLQGIDYVPGTLAIEAADTLRFDLNPKSPYAAGARGWQKGKYRIVLFGGDDPASGRKAITDTSGVALDGEPRAPAGGVISGNGTAAGDFIAAFIVG